MIPYKPDILAVMQQEGLELRRRGHDWWTSCFIHEDKRPSMKVSLDRQSFHCFGCGEHGDVLDFIQKRRGIGFKDALKALGLRPGRPALPDPVVIRRRKLIRAFEAWRRFYRLELSDKSILIHSIVSGAKNRKTPLPECLAFLIAGEMAKLPMIENQLNILISGNDEDVFRLYEDQNGKL